MKTNNKIKEQKKTIKVMCLGVDEGGMCVYADLSAELGNPKTLEEAKLKIKKVDKAYKDTYKNCIIVDVLDGEIRTDEYDFEDEENEGLDF